MSVYSLVTCYEQDERVWGVAKDGDMMFVIDAAEIESPESFGQHLVNLLNSNKKSTDPLDDTEREQFEVLKKMFYHTIPERMPDTYFICGDGGGTNEDTLPEYIFICPAYGVGWSIPYKKVSHEDGE